MEHVLDGNTLDAMSTQVGPTDRRGPLIEVGVFLLLIVPSMALSFLVTQQQDQLGFALTAAATILRDVSLVALILFFLWRAGESPRALGWTSRHIGRDIAIGAALFVPLFFGSRLLESLLLSLGLAAPSSPSTNLVPPRTPADLLLAVVLVVVVAISEERSSGAISSFASARSWAVPASRSWSRPRCSRSATVTRAPPAR